MADLRPQIPNKEIIFSIERSLDWFVRWVYSTGQIEWAMDPSRTFRVEKENFK